MPLTCQIPKPLIQVGKYRLIEYHIFNLRSCGITRIYINRAHLRHKFDDVLKLSDYPGVEINYLDEPDGALETAGAIINAFDKINTDRLIVLNGDIWTNFNYSNIIYLPNNSNVNAHIILVTNPGHNPGGDFSLNGDRLLERNDRGQTYTFTGIGIYRKRMFESWPVKFLKLAPLLREQIKMNSITASICDSKWMDIGTPQRLAVLRETLTRIENAD